MSGDAREHVVFVYGTLMRGLRNWGLMDGARFLGEAVTADATFRLVDLRERPFRCPGVLTGGDAAIRGELFAIDDAILTRLDALENIPTFYTRERAECVVLESNATHTAYIYILADPIEIARAVPVPSGDWRDIAATLKPGE